MNLNKGLCAVLFVVLTAFTASAYTVVMRDGRRVEIPNEFTVTDSTLTYPAGQGIQITVQLNTVDIAATERANGQAAGALLRRASAPKEVSKPVVQTRTPARRSITNRDLETYRQAREKEEQEYEKRRKELGLPSKEERRQEAAEIQERTREQLLSMRVQEESEEGYWRNRASPLRTELASTQAQIEFLQRRINELSFLNSFGVFSTGFPFGTGIPFGTVGAPFINFPFQSGITPNVFGPSLVSRGQGLGSRFGVGFGHRQPRFSPRVPARSNFRGNRGGGFHRGGRGGRGFSSFVDGGLLAVPFQSWDNGLQQAELVSELDELLTHQAGLQARWRDLENEARTAGAYPGWLRP
jgi:hypothetical protein